MKFFVFCLFAIFAVASAKLLLDDEIINAVNSNPKNLWRAGRNKIFEGVTSDRIHEFVGTYMVPLDVPQVSYHAKDIPDSFNAIDNWPNCPTIGQIRDQERCGSCWAFGASEALSDRFCVAGGQDILLSPQMMVSCDKSNYGCQGGYLNLAWNFLVNTGIPSDECYPYTSGNGVTGQCLTKCHDGSDFVLYKVKSGSVVQARDEKTMQTMIMNDGPIEAAFSVYYDFFSYKSGVYHHVSGSLAGGHAIKVVGWGVDTDGTKYWICANSWGTSWGELGGFFWILRGKNECGIESNAIAGIPLL